MESNEARVARRVLLAGAVGIAALAQAPWALAKLPSSGVKGLIGGASDGALDKLAQPGAFYRDTAVRILLPGAGGKMASKLFGMGDKLGLTANLTKSLNDAGGRAAGEAKPIFRSAIDNLRWADAPALVSKKDGATRYLQTSAGASLFTKVSPLIGSALENVGAYRQLDQLGKGNSLMASAGLTRDGLTKSVTEQALKGIFHYMASEEAALRRNPAGLLKGIF
ncbi:MAG: DUF4197 domain-containing protein [Alphaproteobacteria bacterium]|nr:DUF4197 domain-containing protein [Alphaproteobacteria bacterium]MBU0863360.1 DUF4197 domain-containing protein [Alphaproteobacteria bacterium]MBU1824790.1 DUF4197 domain-containing protein [Alphaproteobacteria bacterium]